MPETREHITPDVAAMPTERLEGEIVQLSAHLAAGTCRWLLLVAEFDRREGWASWECVSAAQWLTWKCGIAPGTAREHVRVARALEHLPMIRERFATASLSYSKVRALTRAATPDTEADLLDMAAAMTAGQLDRAMRSYERAFRIRTASDLHDQQAKLGADRWPNDDGTVTWTLRVAPETDALLLRAINHVRQEDRRAAKAAGEPLDGRGGRLPRVDAVGLVVEMALREMARPDSTAVTSSMLLVHTEGRALMGDDGMVHLDGMVLHPRVAKRLGCDTEVQLVECDDGGNPMNKGRRIRLFTRNQKTALMSLFPACGFPACQIPSWMCAFHHILPWYQGGTTDLDNGVPVCARHHWALHEGGWRLCKDHDGKLFAIAPDGRIAPALPPMPPLPAVAPPIEELNDDAGVTVQPDLNPPFERRGIAYAIDVLIANHSMRR